MANIVLAGRSDCPYFARCELLGDRLAKNLEAFKLHKIIVQPEEWETWLEETCSTRGWSFQKSPIVWRELIDRGGKGVLIGDANDFQEYAKAYYDVLSEMTTLDMNVVSWENKVTKDLYDEEEKYYASLSQPIHVCITSAANPICYCLLNSLASGQVFGPEVEIIVHLLVPSINEYELVMGTAMEAEDLASGILRGTKVCSNAHEAFEDCSFIIMLDTLQRKQTESEKEWLERNERFFGRYAIIINDKALKTCKVLLYGNGPLNFNATIVADNAPNLPPQNIVVVSSVIENHAKSVIGQKLGVNSAGVVNLIVWGNVNGSYYLDLTSCQVHQYRGAVRGPDWHSVRALEILHDKKWIDKELPRLVETRHHKVLAAEAEGNQMTGLCSASAIASTLQNWCRGSPLNQIFSLSVSSEGWYGVPFGMYFSFPVTMTLSGSWQVVQDIDITPETTDAIEAAVKEQGRQFMLCMGDRKPSGTPQVLEAASHSSATLSVWSQLSLGRRSAGGDPDKANVQKQDSPVLHRGSQRGEAILELPEESLVTQALSDGNTETPADATLEPEDGHPVEEEPLPTNDSHSQQLADAALTDDNLSQSRSQPLPTDEDNTSQEVVTIEDVSLVHDDTHVFPPDS